MLKKHKRIVALFTVGLLLMPNVFVRATSVNDVNNGVSSVTADGTNIPTAPVVGLTNTGFENGQSPWGVWSDTGAQAPKVVTTDYKNGTHSMQLDNGASIGNYGSSTWQTVQLGVNNSIAVGDSLQIGAWIKASSNVQLGKVGVSLEAIDASNNKTPITSIGLPSDLSNGGWYYVTTNSAAVPAGTASVNVVFSDQSLGTINVDDVSLFDLTPKNSSINPATASFDKNPYTQADITVNMNLNGNTLSSISDGSSPLVSGTDYSVKGSAATISKAYLAKQQVGTKTLTFNFSAGSAASLAVAISDTSKSSVTSDGSNMPTAPASGLTNNGFENGQSPWGVWSDTGAKAPSVVTSAYKNGTHSMQLDNGTSIGNYGSSTWQTVVMGSGNSIAANDYLQIGAWMKAASSVDLSKAGISLEAIDASNNKTPITSMGLPSALSDGAWHYVTTDGVVVPAGTAQVNIVFSDQSLGAINVDDVNLFDLSPKAANSTITPTSATFDKKTVNQADIKVDMTLNGNTLTNIKDGSNALSSGTDYTVSGSTVTISKSYLALQATGPKALTFNFSSGAPQTLNISIVDSSTINLNAHDYTMVSPGFEDFTTPSDDNGWGIWPGPLHGLTSSDPWNGTGMGIVTDPVHEGSKALGMGPGAALWQRIYDGANGCADGDVVEVSAWAYAYPDSVGSFIEVDAVDAMANGTHTLIAKSRAITADDAGKWVQLTTVPAGAGKIPAGSVGGIVISIQNSASKLILDGFTARSLGNNGLGGTDANTGNKGSSNPYPALSVYPLGNTSFEDSSSVVSSWGTWGNVAVDSSEAYYGKNSVKLSGATAIWQTANVGTNANDPKVGQAVEAGTWIYLNSDVDLSQVGSFRLQVNAVDASSTKTKIAESQPLAANTPKGQWVYVKTQAVGDGTIPSASTGIVVSIESGINGTVNADYTQAGQAGAINGNPNKFSMLAYQPWYGNPTDTADAADGWYNWLWNQAGTPHNPDTILPNGQRDIASALYPLVGPYDSVNMDLLKYQFDLAKAAQFNGFMIDDYGREIKQRYRQNINEMFNLAEQYDMKVAFQYEAKVNIVGWAPSTATGTRQQKVDGVVADLKYILDNYSSKKAFLKYNGVPVISIFGDGMLTDDEWNYVLKSLNDMGYQVNLMGDGIGSGSDMTTVNAAFGSMYNWHLIDNSLKPSSSPNYDTVYNYAVNNDQGVRRWVSVNPQNRFGVGMIWPGFNDSGVDGWGGGTRQVDYLDNDPKGDTLQATSQAVLDSGVNFALVATMNDWNECTSVEPSKEKGTKYMKELALFNQKFKGLSSVDTSAIDTITANYLANPNVVKFNVIPLGIDATLSGITVNGNSVKNFDKNTMEYTVELPAGTTAVPTVEAAASDNRAKVIVTPASDLKGTTTITVTSDDTLTTKTYKLSFTVAAAPPVVTPPVVTPPAVTPPVPNVASDVVIAIQNSNGQTITVDTNSNTTVDKSIFEAIKGKDQTVTFEKKAADGTVLISWTFNGKDINGEIKDIQLDASFTSKYEAQMKAKVNNYPVLPLSFSYDGTLPGKTTVKLMLDSTWLSGKDKNNLYVYYYNTSTGKAELVAGGLKADDKGYIQFDLTHFSNYFISDKDLVAAGVLPKTGSVVDFNVLVLGGIGLILLGTCYLAFDNRRRKRARL